SFYRSAIICVTTLAGRLISPRPQFYIHTSVNFRTIGYVAPVRAIRPHEKQVPVALIGFGTVDNPSFGRQSLGGNLFAEQGDLRNIGDREGQREQECGQGKQTALVTRLLGAN